MQQSRKWDIRCLAGMRDFSVDMLAIDFTVLPKYRPHNSLLLLDLGLMVRQGAARDDAMGVLIVPTESQLELLEE